jgi:hypothetical protein
MTLQFVGGGLLDESELNETTADINRAPASLASMATLPAPQPTSGINLAPGMDVTKPLSVPQMAVPAPFSSGTITPQHIPGTEPIEPLVQIEPAEPKRRRRRTKAEMAQAAVNIALDAVTAQNPEATKLMVHANQLITEAQAEAIPDNIPDKVSGNTMTVALNSNVSQLAVTNSIPPICEIHKETMVLRFYERPGGPPGNGYICQSCCSQRTLDANIEKVTTELLNHTNETTDYPTAEQEADYRKRLQSWVDILKTAGMTGGINWRLKRYTLAMFPDAVVDNGRLRLTGKQWDTLLADFDTKQHQLGPQALVAEINTIAEKA